MSKQWFATGFGDLGVLELRDVDVPPPGVDDVTIAVRASGMNPADFKSFAKGPNSDPSRLPIALGFEVSGVVDEAGDESGFEPGQEVLAYRISGGYAERVTVPAADVFAKPTTLSYPQAANLLLVGATAAEMLHVTGVGAGDTIVLHGASGSVGVSVLQQARLLGVRVIGTASERNFDTVRNFGGVPVAYGDGLLDRLREQSDHYAAALDTVGTDEAVETSLALVPDRSKIVTIAAFGRAEQDGIQAIAGATPDSARYRNEIRTHLVELAERGELTVPVARTFPMAEAPTALELLRSGHPGGKLALIP